MTAPHADDPFAVLGLAPSPAVTDDEVRAAWRRVAASTHPDRADGGDPQAFAAAAAAYTTLRTTTGRREVLADATAPAMTVPTRGPGPVGLRLVPARIRGGRPVVLAARVAAAAGLGAVAVTAAGWQPATPAIITGSLTWLILTARGDLAPPP
jgi:hypothetical protein